MKDLDEETPLINKRASRFYPKFYDSDPMGRESAGEHAQRKAIAEARNTQRKRSKEKKLNRLRAKRDFT